MSMRRRWQARLVFVRELFRLLSVAWPIFSMIVLLVALLGLSVADAEDWHWHDGLWFAFTTATTIGYGDFVPHTRAGRFLTVGIGLLGILFTALLAAVTVRALGNLEELMTPPGHNSRFSVINHTNKETGGNPHDPEGDRDGRADRRHGDQAAEPQSADPTG
jgi:Ion channel